MKVLKYKQMKRNRSAVIAILLILLQSALYGFGDPVSKAAFDTVPLFTMLTLRYSIALIVMLLIWGKRIIKGIKECNWRDWIIPVLCIGGAYVSNNVALLLTEATTVAFIRSLPTLIAPILAFVFYRRFCGKKLIGVQLLVVAGLYMLCCGSNGIGNIFGWGEFFALLSAILLAGALVAGEHSVKTVDPIVLTALQTAASVIMAVVGRAFSTETMPSVMPLKVWGIILYLAILCTLAGYLLQNLALKSIQSQTIAVVQASCPVLTAVFSFFVLGEKLNVMGVIGAAVIVICLIAAVYLDKPETE